MEESHCYPTYSETPNPQHQSQEQHHKQGLVIGQAEESFPFHPSRSTLEMAETPTPAPGGASHHILRDRRREKPMLSCTFCRARKVRCDRKIPCETCNSKGIGFSCHYATAPGSRSNKPNVSDRIQQLESLISSLVQQQTQQQQAPRLKNEPVSASPAGPSVDISVAPPIQTSAASPSSAPGPTDSISVNDDMLAAPVARHLPSTPDDRARSPAPTEYGSMRMHTHGANYVGSVHWAAVLDSITELKDTYEQEEEARILASSDHVLTLGPRLLYEPLQVTMADVIAAVPPRAVVDRMVARYFNTQGLVPQVLHCGHFLQEYERFWKNPSDMPVLWISCLFSIMCLTTLYQQFLDAEVDPDAPIKGYIFLEQVVYCLNIGRYSRGGDYSLEAVLNYLICEMLICKNTESGVWILHGMTVQLALSLGYHRDSDNFPNISPFAGEMRRRVWSAIVQLDLRLSSQMALPRLLNVQQYDTTDPRNLFDSDFDETTTTLPPSRPETDVTPVLYSLARKRLDQLNGLISDIVNDTKDHPYEEIMELDKKVQEAEASLPPSFRWQALSQSFMILPQIIMHRIFLQLAIQRVLIWLHRKYLTPSFAGPQTEHSRTTCVQAAIKILEFQQMIEEETKVGGLLFPMRWAFTSSRSQAVFLLGLSILYYQVQLVKTRPEVSIDEETSTKIHELLKNTYPSWVKLSTVSDDARRAILHLSVLLGLRDKHDTSGGHNAEEGGGGTADSAIFSSDTSVPQITQMGWGTFPGSGVTGDFAPMAPMGNAFAGQESMGATDLQIPDLLWMNTGAMDGWMNLN